MRTVFVVAAAAALLLAACSDSPVQLSHHVQAGAQLHAKSLPNTRWAAQITGPARALATAVNGPVYSFRDDHESVSGFVSNRGLLVTVWPGPNAQGISTSPGRLLLLDPMTGKAENLMGLAAPGLESVMVTSDREWVFWALTSDLGGGPQTYYLYNLRTGARRRFSDGLTASNPFGALSGAALQGDNLYVTGDTQTGRCVVSEVLRVDLLRRRTTST